MSDDTVETIERGERLRARILVDLDPSEPYDDGSAPVVFVEYRTGKAHQSGPDTSYAVPSEILDAFHHYSGSRYDRDELVERYLRIWHGTTVFESASDLARDGILYTFDTAHWRETVGAPLPVEGVTLGQGSEWRAYVEGDVYGIVIERLTTWTSDRGKTRETWDVVDSMWGFYGLGDYVREYAREMLDGQTV